MSFFGGNIFSEGKQAGGFFWGVNKKENLLQLTFLKADSTPLLKQETPLSPGLKMKPRTPTLISPSVFGGYQKGQGGNARSVGFVTFHTRSSKGPYARPLL